MDAERRRLRSHAFGEAAELYDRRRPGYPPELLDDAIATAAASGPVERALEAGAGTGRATLALARRGIRVDAVEHDPQMAAVARAAVAGLAVDVHVGAFEEWRGEEGAYDLVFSAQAWHWIDPERGLAVARRALRPGGAIALFWNLSERREDSLRRALDAAYEPWAPELIGTSIMNHSSGGRIDPVTLAGDGFDDPRVRSYRWSRSYDAVAYGELLQTHSDHRLLPPERLTGLIEAVEETVREAGGGEIVLDYRADLVTAVRSDAVA